MTEMVDRFQQGLDELVQKGARQGQAQVLHRQGHPQVRRGDGWERLTLGACASERFSAAFRRDPIPYTVVRRHLIPTYRGS